MAKYRKATRECDVIMKGGITSGIVYPKAILTLADEYRFRSIGGASAGAIAAAITAAAEFGRASGGFEEIENIPDDLRDNLTTLFQPAKDGRVLFSIFYRGFLQHKWIGVLATVARAHWPAVLAGFLVGIVAALVSYAIDGGLGGLVPGILLGLVMAAVLGLFSLLRRSLRDLEEAELRAVSGSHAAVRKQAGD